MDSWADHSADRIIHVTHIGREAPAVADLGRWCAELADRVAELETLLADERRENARMRARTAPSARKAPIWLLPFAYVGLAWGQYTDSYAYETQEEAKR